ncbi:MAG: hypothetical protein IJ614_03140 [Prevotella sp.]|nr:hypothetical protein [Prevotella sp.]
MNETTIEMREDADNTQKHKLTIEQFSTLIARIVAAIIKKDSVTDDWLDKLPQNINDCLLNELIDFEHDKNQNDMNDEE